MDIAKNADQPCACCGAPGSNHAEPIYCSLEKTLFKSDGQKQTLIPIRESEICWEIPLCPKCETISFKEQSDGQLKTTLSWIGGSFFLMIITSGIFYYLANATPEIVSQEYGPGLSRGFPLFIATVLACLVAIASAATFIGFLPKFAVCVWNKINFGLTQSVPVKQRVKAYRRFAELILNSLTKTAQQFHGLFNLPKADSQCSAPQRNFDKMETSWILETEAEHDLAKWGLIKLEAFFRGMPYACLTRLAELPNPPAALVKNEKSCVLVAELAETISKLPPEDPQSQFLKRLFYAASRSMLSRNRIVAIVIWSIMIVVALLDLFNRGAYQTILFCKLPTFFLLFLFCAHTDNLYRNSKQIIGIINGSCKNQFPTQLIPISPIVSRRWMAAAWIGILLSILEVIGAFLNK